MRKQHKKILDQAKGSEDPAKATVLMQDPECRLLAAAMIGFTEQGLDTQGHRRHRTWEHLVEEAWWICVEDLMEATGLSYQTVVDKWTILARNRLVYPDGTVAKTVHAILTSAVVAQVKKMKPRKDERKDDTGAVD